MAMEAFASPNGGGQAAALENGKEATTEGMISKFFEAHSLSSVQGMGEGGCISPLSPIPHVRLSTQHPAH